MCMMYTNISVLQIISLFRIQRYNLIKSNKTQPDSEKILIRRLTRLIYNIVFVSASPVNRNTKIIQVQNKLTRQ